MSAIISGGISLAINGINAFAFSDDKVEKTLNSTVNSVTSYANAFQHDQQPAGDPVRKTAKKVSDYFLFTNPIAYVCSIFHFISLSNTVLGGDIADFFGFGIVITILSGGVSLIATYAINYFTNSKVKNDDIKDLDRSINISSIMSTKTLLNKTFLKASIITNLVLLIFTPQFSIIYIINTLFLAKTIYHVYKQEFVAVKSSFQRRIHYMPSIFSFGGNDLFRNGSLDNFEITANLNLKKAPDHFNDQCDICYDGNSNKYYFCTKHIFDLGCILKHFSYSLQNVNFSNLKITEHRNQYGGSYKTTSLTLDKSSLPSCPMCRDPYHHEPEISMKHRGKEVTIN